MSEPFLGELKLISFNYAPKGWAACDGQFMAINQNQALFALLGTQFGGNGQTTFALPDLRGRIAVHAAGKYTMGQAAGEVQHTLTGQEMPAPGHNHVSNGTSNTGTSYLPQGQVFANVGLNAYGQSNPPQPVASGINSVGGQPHPNMSPYQVLFFCIALQGIFPSQN
jgi:microcystin-dependent protein